MSKERTADSPLWVCEISRVGHCVRMRLKEFLLCIHVIWEEPLKQLMISNDLVLCCKYAILQIEVATDQLYNTFCVLSDACLSATRPCPAMTS